MYDVAAYIATLDGSISAATVQADVALGSTYYRQFCAACHGPAAEGNPALNAPTLAGADDWYLAAQMRAFRDGVRGTHPQDRTGKQMRVMAAVLPDDQAVDAVVAYIRSLGQ
jgi:cytochrome c553